MCQDRSFLLPMRLATASVIASSSVMAGETKLTSIRIATFTDAPVFVTHAPGDFERLFVIEKPGRVVVIRNGKVLNKPFLNLTDIVQHTVTNERGLLGLAFHPDYETNGFFYVYYTAQPEGDITLPRFEVTADPDIADRESLCPILSNPHPAPNHNAGWIDFGIHDGFLYVAIGDGGGGAFDPGDDAQNLDVLLGKLLRLDVDSDDFPQDPDRNYAIPPDNPFVGVDGADEIWAYGLRNPWRCSFDRETGDIYIADVGQSSREELNFRPASSTGGENFGWDCKEGTLCTKEDTCDCADPELVDPMFEFVHDKFPTAIIGGYMYRGCAIPDLVGAYIFANRRIDIGHPIWQLRHDNGKINDLQEIQDELDPGNGLSIGRISSFGEDAFGELYICDTHGHELFKIVPAKQAGPDCNDNGVPDACDIASGASQDVNNNGIPDECEDTCPWDLDGTGIVGASDLLALLASWGQCKGCSADFDRNGAVGASDLLALLANWGPCP